MRLLAFAALALLLEIGWLAVWPLSAALSHSSAFTSDVLAAYPPVTRLFQLSLAVARLVLPDLSATPIAELPGSAAYFAPATTFALVLLFLAAVYVLALFVLERGLGGRPAAVWIVLGGAVVFQATLLFLPGLFSQDVFSYIAYGRLAAVYELNPYVWPPSAIAKDAVLPWVADVWRAYAAPYGPLWLDVQWLLARALSAASIATQAMAYRVLANVLLLANLGLVWVALGHLRYHERAQRTTALAALAWNPLVLFEVSANAHNDVLMVTCSLLALVLFARSRSGVLAGASFTLGALVKYLSGVGLVWVAVAAAARADALRAQVRRLALVGLCSVAIGGALMVPWLELPDSLEPLVAETVGVGFVNALPDSLAVALADQVLGPAGMQEALAREQTRSMERLLVAAIFGVYLIWETRRVWSDASATAVIRASARSCLVYVLVVSTSVQPWYFCLPVAMAVLLGWRAGLTRVIVGYSLLAAPALYLSYYLREATPFGVSLVYGLVPLAPLAPALSGWLVRRAAARAREPASPQPNAGAAQTHAPHQPMPQRELV
ncbi:MAG: hypothetical protein LC797_07070 [Chloroflexi bacterium]|nr:hypothetical protein [Chloroflexota bacterium]